MNKRNPKSPILTVDGLIVERGKILMVKRNIDPFLGYWVLPGGHVDYGEKVEDAIKREMKEELGVTVRIKKLIGVYSNPKRDPRYHTVTIAFFLERTRGEIAIDYEASEYKFFSFNQLPQKIGFDHRKVINDLRKSNVRRLSFSLRSAIVQKRSDEPYHDCK